MSGKFGIDVDAASENEKYELEGLNAMENDLNGNTNAAYAGWQPIETAPLDNGMPCYFLVYTTHQNILMGFGIEGELSYLTFMDGFTFNPECYGVVTHWMPLPNPPKV